MICISESSMLSDGYNRTWVIIPMRYHLDGSSGGFFVGHFMQPNCDIQIDFALNSGKLAGIWSLRRLDRALPPHC